MKWIAAIAVLAFGTATTSVSAQPARPLTIVAAENCYGDVAHQIAGADVRVTSILQNPDQDPRLFEPVAATARAVASARIIIYNGADYDPWMVKLLAASKSDDRVTLVIADLMGRKAGDNPHLWYDPETMPGFAQALTATLITADPGHETGYRQRLARFTDSVKPIDAKVAALRARLAGTPVTATEPVFGYMFEALGMIVRNPEFQLAVMNKTEPSASAVADFETDLKTHLVKLLVYDAQATDPIATRMQAIARAARIPIVPVTETEPPGRLYQSWILGQLDAIDRALPK